MGFRAGAPTTHTTVPHRPAQVFSYSWDGGVLIAQCKKVFFGFWGGAPICLCPFGQHRCFWIPRMGAFELHYAKQYCLSSGVAPQAVIPFYPICQQRCFQISRNGVFEQHNTKLIVGFRAGALKTHTIVPNMPAQIFLIPRKVSKNQKM